MALEIRRAGLSGLVGASLGLALGGLSGCGDDFGSNDCRATRTCRVAEEAGAAGQAASNGAGGGTDASSGGDSTAAGGADSAAGAPVVEGGAAGAGGAPVVVVVPDCVSDGDCDDKLACNGAETCDSDGHCALGEPPVCANADSANCSAACVERAGGHECVVSANDTDLDGHASALCAVAPGDDCDDAQKTVYAGAPELCDRLDNDCDKKIDLADGLEFAGKSNWVGTDVDHGIRAEGSVAAWSGSSKLYGMLWRVRGLTDLVVALYDAKGARKAGPITVGHSSVGRFAISAGATGFGVVWNLDSEQKTEFRTLSAKGELGAQTALTGRLGIADAPLGLAWSSAAKRWEVAAERGTAAVSAAGVGQAFVAKLEAAYQVEGIELVAAGSSFVLGVSGRVMTKLDRPEPRLYQYEASATLTPATDRLTFDKSLGASVVHVAARSDGSFATLVPAVSAASSIVTSFDATGARACAYTEPARASDLTGTAAGYTLTLFGTPAATNFRDLSASCEAGSVVETEFVYPYEPTLVASPTSYLHLWSDDDGNSFYSIFGSSYCG